MNVIVSHSATSVHTNAYLFMHARKLNLQNIYDDAYERHNYHCIGINVEILVQHTVQREVEEECCQNPNPKDRYDCPKHLCQ